MLSKIEIVADDIHFFLNYFLEKISLGILCELSALAADSHEKSSLRKKKYIYIDIKKSKCFLLQLWLKLVQVHFTMY